ncbi:single-stranded-DNA-specific exonuclease RecJ [Alphaproteobacteria bacterium]|nr:single-stranded-DNA-specific exonuclease RecJ [Alphaproteobacteria bacterium]
MAGDATLGIVKSFSGARWVPARSSFSASEIDRYAAALVETVDDLPLPIARIMAGRGLTVDSIAAYLEPRLRESLPDPSRFQDLDKAAARLADCVEEGAPIGIFGDYDVDGACAAALLLLVMRQLGVTCDVHIPNRFREGYGPNIDALMALRKKGASLLVTVDCGITAHAPLAAVAETGMDVIVIDHHIAGPELPKAHSVVNPNRLDEDGAYGYLCAASVVFVVIAGMLRTLRQRGYFCTTRPAPDLLSHLDLVALATVCDVVPLVELNRAFVRQGLKVMAQRQHHGLAKLADIAGVNEAPNAYALGFLLGPRINAAGRLGASGLGVKLLAAEDPDTAAGLALQLDDMNKERRRIEESVRNVALDRAAQTNHHVIILSDCDWHEGVIGIVAGRVRERFGKPAMIISMGADGVGKGSARGIAGFRLGNAVIAAHQAGIIEGGGGHNMAAGFSVLESQIENLQEFMNDRFMAEFNGVMPQVTHTIGAVLSVAGCQPLIAAWLDKLGPFGSGNAEPRFVIPDCRIKSARRVGADGAHLSCRLDDGSGILNAIAFQAGGTAVGQALEAAVDGRYLHILGRVRRDRFRGGDAVQIEIDDAAEPKLAAGFNS